MLHPNEAEQHNLPSQDKIKPISIALVGNPNCGKTALFNRLTGARQKVANYAGATVERKSGQFTSDQGYAFHIVDLPGTYSLNTTTPDEIITRNVLVGKQAEEFPTDIVALIVDATNLRRSLRMVLEVIQLGYPTILVLNMMDMAHKRGQIIDVARLKEELGIPVVQTVAIQPKGANALITQLEQTVEETLKSASIAKSDPSQFEKSIQPISQEAITRILNSVIQKPPSIHKIDERIDAVVLHPVFGYLFLFALLFFIFQAVFSWAEAPMELIEGSITSLGSLVGNLLPEGILRSLIVDGILSGIGSVLVFLPQILILFFFLLVLEESGYLPRAAFLLDRVMGSVGLSGRAFIPLLSSFACAIPGVMAARTIQNPRDRLITIMVAPLMVCSARLPVYSLIIGAFIPSQDVGPFNLQGLVLFALYVIGIASAMLVAYIIKRLVGKKEYQPLMLELPAYHWPHLRSLAIGLWERARIFLTRAGTIILALMILLWFVSTFPTAPEGATEAAIQYSFAGRMGHFIQPFFEPLGFNWQIAIALILGVAAREVAVGALGTVYALSATGDALPVVLTSTITASWSLATALSLLAWYVFAPQCLATLIVVKRETNSWKWMAIMTVYLFSLAYLASLLTYQISSLLIG